MSGRKLLRVEGLSFSYDGKRQVLDCVNAEVCPGAMISLLGPNGSGKSTLLNCIAGLLSYERGAVYLEGRELRSLRQRDIARLVACVPQRAEAGFAYTVADYVLMGRTAYMGIFSAPGREDYAIAAEALAMMGLESLARRPFSRLSGGEQQQVCITRAIAQRPKLILLDEPMSALDYGNQIKVLETVRRLASLGFAVLMSTHNPEHPILLESDVWILSGGVLTCGSRSQMITEENLQRLYKARIRVLRPEGMGREVCAVEALAAAPEAAYAGGKEASLREN